MTFYFFILIRLRLENENKRKKTREGDRKTRFENKASTFDAFPKKSFSVKEKPKFC